ncbi:helix-turn-helix domain-containing protein [Roseobacter sp. HKCCD9010]|uniref:helix-turn-helix domain-containing protein n=1 Tax=unclassified Roseobacter TaxID=196798 RepID=UPI001491ED3E|nr:MULTISPECIES: helix-turn-helix transcriptional regulator [unclassified Roseobacter]MBF9052041.1 helix-turn-helix domain-containing protein [Rhodobacterales bacterium HKCCD4356]NNV13965.1 helix-turn-helix domain-containing protein [Roseobacter sp. HKCCD7357]NNV18206.1 helix-turn-helix domain-containing protein [Roseobacter sp. HKCCD8768]NNV27666.1 helix-turn-helix domain-containing protein [Roseobacter sp. HKCCD8192]NNV31978.1 helix-turn-helix domain-containing protein [Roseobacter sp. HKCCD
MSGQSDTLQWAQKIGDRLRKRRKLLGLSLEDLSRLSGSTVPTLSNIERGKRDVKLSTLVSLATALRIDLSILFVKNEIKDAHHDPQSGTIGYDLDDD